MRKLHIVVDFPISCFNRNCKMAPGHERRMAACLRYQSIAGGRLKKAPAVRAEI
jgi:hypothetical protein